MVCDINKILDEGSKKNLPECNKMSSEDYLTWNEFNNKHIENTKHDVKCLDTYLGIKDMDYKFSNKLRSYEYWEKYFNTREFKAKGINWKSIIDSMYVDLKKERFLHHYMINISPDWKLKKNAQPSKLMIAHLTTVIEEYLAESDRWDEALYTLENGSEGNFLHAHIVAKPNLDILKSVDTHMNKGNHSVQIRKRWDKICKSNPKLVGYVGCLKGRFSIQKIVLRNPELIKDKQNYLLEHLKPDGHTNIEQKYLNTRRSWSKN